MRPDTAMVDVLFLMTCAVAGVWILVRSDLFGFRGSTLLGFFLLTLGMTSPLALHPARMMLDSGAGTDAYIGVWNLWWTRVALDQWRNPYETAMIFAPNGTSLALHSYSFLYALVSVPIQWLLRVVTGTALSPQEQLFVVYNLVLIVSFTLAGYFTYRLAMEETGHRGASILAGVVFAYSNFRFANTVRSHVIPGELVVLAAWAWVRFLKSPGPRRLILWAGSMVMLIYGSLELAAYAAVLVVVLGIPRVPRPRIRDLRRLAVPAIAAAAGSAFLLLPFIAALVRRLKEGGAGFPSGMALFFSADVLDFLLPNPRHPIWGEPFKHLTGVFHLGDSGFGLSVGLTAIGLFLLSARILLRQRTDRRWFWAAVVLLVFSLGPGLHIAGYVVPLLPMPQELISRVLPFLGMSRTPLRYAAVASLCISMTIACGWALRGRMRRVEVLLVALILLESLSAPMPVVRVPVRAVHALVAERSKSLGGGSMSAERSSGQSALIHIPGFDHRTELLYQTAHGQALIASVLNAVPLRSGRGPDAFDAAAWRVLTRGLGDAEWWSSIPEAQKAAVRADLRAMLRDLRVRWIVLTRTHDQLSADARSFESRPQLTRDEFASFHERLRELGPVGAEQVDDAILFEFPSNPR